MKATVFALFSVEASHVLSNLPDGHKCRRLHGHTYQIRVEVRGDVGPLGWVLDYAEIERAFRDLVFAKIDHQHINDALPELAGNTTSENLATWIRDIMSAELGLLLSDVAVEVWETATCGARVGFTAS